MNGFDGFGGAHRNLLWYMQQGVLVYTLNNKVIFEDTKQRKQTVHTDSDVRLSCLARSTDGGLIAAAEGEPNSKKVSLIYLYSFTPSKLKSKLTFHSRGIQSLEFLSKNILVSLGVVAENILVIWDLAQGLVLDSVRIQSHATNQIIVNQELNDQACDDKIHFCSTGTKGHFTFW